MILRQVVFNSEEDADKALAEHGIEPAVKIVLEESCEIYIDIPLTISFEPISVQQTALH